MSNPSDTQVTDPYPEHTKLAAVREASQKCGEFLEWLKNTKGFVLAQWGTGKYDNVLYPEYSSTRDLLAEFFGIDQDKLEAEKLAMLGAIRMARAAEGNGL